MEMLQSVREHTASITDLQLSYDKTFFITSSKDNTAKIYDASDLTLKKTFQTERPVNSASVSPIRDEAGLSSFY
jgi:translation initiation factor 3 subunit I